MSKKKLTNKELTEAIAGLSNNDQLLRNEILEMKQLFGLYLEWKKDKDTFNKFVEDRVKEYNNKENEPGETK